ncbi:MAG: molybdopterin molybdotransferase MoeA [Methylobacter sp.]|nr:molybdopterin molybdotransferase MoeA [Methylobacter sp.]
MIDACSQDSKRLLTLQEALDNIKTNISAITDTEILPLQNALGRVLAADVYSPINLPFDRNAAMDGYAYASADNNPEQAFTLTRVGTSWAGKPFTGQLQSGECIRIFTGAVVPPEADSVLMQEHATAVGENIQFPADAKPLQNIREAGEDIKQGELLCKAGKKLSTFDIGLLAAVGVSEVIVLRPVNIAYFSTGDELTALGQPLESGKIYDSNRYTLNGLLTDPAYRASDLGVIADDPQQLETQFTQAAKNHDVIISTGGASVGDADYVKDILARCGSVNFWKLAIKPGKPLAYGTIGNCHFFGLPGNPVAVVVTFQQLVTPALRKLSGADDLKKLRLQATATCPLKKAPGRQEFLRGIFSQTDDGEIVVTSAGRQGSHILSSMSRSNCFIVLPAACSGIQAGDKVVVEPFDLFL